MLHRVNEDSLKLRTQIEKFVQAGTELSNSRLRLERNLASVEAGFIAFDPADISFSVNQRAVELLNTDRQTLLEEGIKFLLAGDKENHRFNSLLNVWNFAADVKPVEGESDAKVEAMELLLHHLDGQEKKASGKVVRFNTRNELFGENEAMPEEKLQASALPCRIEAQYPLQIVLFGQPELDQQLDLPNLRNVSRLIRVAFSLPLLEQNDLNAFVAHRLNKAGLTGRLFYDDTLIALHKVSHGIPRPINILCH